MKPSHELLLLSSWRSEWVRGRSRHAHASNSKQNRLNFDQLNVDCFPRVRVFAEVAHHLELEAHDKLVFRLLQELFGKRSFLHIIKMEENVLLIDV